jgi:hypothetical protein
MALPASQRSVPPRIDRSFVREPFLLGTVWAVKVTTTDPGAITWTVQRSTESSPDWVPSDLGPPPNDGAMSIEVDRCPGCGSIEISLRYASHGVGISEGAIRTGKCWDCRYQWSSIRTAGQPWSLTTTAFEVRGLEAQVPTS